MATSIREQILVNLKSRFSSVQPGVDGHTVEWLLVERAPINNSNIRNGEVISILDAEEVKTPRIAHMECNLTVVTEFWYKMKQGDEGSTEANRLLADVQKTMREDIYSNGLTYNIIELRNSLDVDSVNDRLVNGVIFWQVNYRHKLNDPTQLC